ncbi:MAG TPA: glycosyltransferase [Candidatus Aminicenantes bacterium]|nr:glycosyltransferase [Candidatus Aminicenantes bacterium]
MSTLRPRVLASAYACHPRPATAHFPGEAILGWNLAREIAAFADLHLITWGFNRDGLEGTLAAPDGRPAEVHYVDLPPRLHEVLRDRHLGTRVYYYLWQKAAAKAARELHRRRPFDLFHQITFSNDWMPSYAAPSLPVPFVWGPVGGGQKVPRELMPTLARRDRRQERSRVRLQNVWRATPARRRTAAKASAILVCNRETEAVLSKWREKIVPFPVNGIDRRDLAAEPPAPGRRDGFRLLYVGRFDPIKGLPLALEALGLLRETAPGAVLELVGEGPEKPRLEALAARLGVSDGLAWAPWSPRSEIFVKMRRSDVFLFPSLRDGGGAVVVEAMACGLPVVCLDLAGPGLHVRDGWGVKVRPGRPGAVAAGLAAALEKLRRDPGLRDRMGREARARAESFYEWGRLGERLRAIYADALAGRPPRREERP